LWSPGKWEAEHSNFSLGRFLVFDVDDSAAHQ
jgi:hypothetical protein